MSQAFVVLNAGSSSIKFALHEARAPFAAARRGLIEGIGTAPHLRLRDAAGDTVLERRWPAEGFDHARAMQETMALGPDILAGSALVAAGHRVVHGGLEFAGPVRVTPAILERLAALSPLAPLHQPHNLAPIRALAALTPELPQIACFDTGFHRSQAPVAQAFALPRRMSEAGIRRYGFHGLSYEFIATQLERLDPALAQGRVIVAHLGNGASLCAMRHGQSVASTMGFTAADGLMMGTRCGALDAGVLIHLMDTEGMDARALEALIYKESGLLGVSGISSDMRTLRASADPHAAEAVALFIYRIIREIGSLVAAMGGLDGLIFTAGIGENDAGTRAEVAAGCGWLGLTLDAARNAAGQQRISAEASRVSAWVVPTDEEGMIARHMAEILA
ncbi:acetate/propionate family kinase [Sediminicoccus sp. KRV36]|uniref:acetate/propionate family kinase n=1 Tax=Sediminicoccus sp. KRV36 TaxID=3133721 RepID=UPI00200E3520|nr:acetate/propionate family kinase [Sediminicoccus rosea]UPY38448.1 acetate/propionate family kinase [Sediminicoccus rosea]